MRPIKFRAWDGYNIRYDVTGTEHGRDNDVGGVFLDGEYFALSDNSLHPKAELMQFTGLKDKNGLDVYEGDIVNTTYPGHPTRKAEVYFQPFRLNWSVKHGKHANQDLFVYARPDCEIEVIGNIYDKGNSDGNKN